MAKFKVKIELDVDNDTDVLLGLAHLVAHVPKLTRPEFTGCWGHYYNFAPDCPRSVNGIYEVSLNEKK